MKFLARSIGKHRMGTGIATMHYTGMAAMRVAAMCHSRFAAGGLSVIFCYRNFFVALWLAFLAREESKGWRFGNLSATVMGAAIPVITALHSDGRRPFHKFRCGAGSFAFRPASPRWELWGSRW